MSCVLYEFTYTVPADMPADERTKHIASFLLEEAYFNGWASDFKVLELDAIKISENTISHLYRVEGRYIDDLSVEYKFLSRKSMNKLFRENK